jgi:hypothetical protein
MDLMVRVYCKGRRLSLHLLGRTEENHDNLSYDSRCLCTYWSRANEGRKRSLLDILLTKLTPWLESAS